MCNYDLAWIGKCEKEATINGMCEQHSIEKCIVCGNPATHQCAETYGLVCGSPLCNDCEHELTEQGVNSFGHHCRKSEQKYEPWYIQQEANH